MHWAAFYERLKMIKLLLSYDADPTLIDLDGHSTLHLSTGNKSTKCFVALLKACGDKANPNLQDSVRVVVGKGGRLDNSVGC